MTITELGRHMLDRRSQADQHLAEGYEARAQRAWDEAHRAWEQIVRQLRAVLA